MNIIVTADSNWGISYKGKPLAAIPAEKKSRMQEIAGKVAVYTLKCIDDLPGQQPVRGCVNLIFTDGVKTNVKPSDSVYLFDSLEELRKKVESYPSEDVYIIDGEKLYREFLKDTDVVHVTRIDYEYHADAFFEDMDKNPDFVVTGDSEEQYCFDIVYNFYRYERRKKN